MLTIRMGGVIAPPPSGNGSRFREWIPLAFLLVTGISNGVLYETVLAHGPARLVIGLNFLISAAAILFCLRKSLRFSRNPAAKFPQRKKLFHPAFVPASETGADGCLMEQDTAMDERLLISDFPFDEAFQYADTFLN